MQIDTIHYSRKTSDGNYGNAELGMHAQLEEGEDPAECAHALRRLVTEAHAHENQLTRQYEQGEEHLHQITREVENKKRDLERMEGQWRLARAFLEQHGVDVSRYTDVPF